jgi:molybdate transport system substrate-binding protein
MDVSAKSSFSERDWQVRIGVWVERHGQAVLGEGRLELLECIERCRSISAAAREIGVSYRHAWVVVQAINHAAGEPLVTASVGGDHGGGAVLTPCGRWAIQVGRALQEHLQRTAECIFPNLASNLETDVLHVAAAVSLEEVLAALVTDYTQFQAGARVRIVLGASDELAQILRTGAGLDLFLTADPEQFDLLSAQHLVQAESITALAENTLAAIGNRDLSERVNRPADLLGLAGRRIALAVPSCPLGAYTRAYLAKLGLYEAVLERAVLVDHSRAVVAAVETGQAAAGFVYTSATATAQKCQVLFSVRRPPVPVRYAGAVLSRSQRPLQARRFLEFLASGQAARRFRHHGFRSVRRAK